MKTKIAILLFSALGLSKANASTFKVIAEKETGNHKQNKRYDCG